MRKACFTWLLVFAPLWIQAQTLLLHPSNSKVNFTIKNLGIEVDGRFSSLKGQLNVNPTSGLPEFLFGEIEVNSISTGIAMRDRHLMKPDYFHASRHPNIKFRSERISSSGKLWLVKGWLSMKGISQPIQIQAEITKTGDGYLLKSKFSIRRSSFNIGDSALLSEVVHIDLNLSFTP